jgi:hypothetical protein
MQWEPLHAQAADATIKSGISGLSAGWCEAADATIKSGISGVGGSIVLLPTLEDIPHAEVTTAYMPARPHNQ